MNEAANLNPMRPAILLSAVLHVVVIAILLMVAIHRPNLHRQQIIEVSLGDWPQEVSLGTSNSKKPSRPTHPLQQPRSDKAIPETAQPSTDQVAEPPIENQTAQPPTQSESIQSKAPEPIESQTIPQSQAGPSLSPPQFDAAYLHNPKPEYPVAARRFGFQGTVVLRVLIGLEGSPTEIRVEKSSGHNVLDEAALAAVKQWQFEPAREGDLRVAGWVDVPIQFRLE